MNAQKSKSQQPEAQTTPAQQDLSYLYEDPDPIAQLEPQAEFHMIRMGFSDARELNGERINGDKFSCEAFPRQNNSELYLIPLLVKSNARSAFLTPWKQGENRGPDCTSQDGITPQKPLQYAGQTITNCAACPLWGFGKDYPCGDRPIFYGLAYFPEENDLVPVMASIPATSVKVFRQFEVDLAKQVQVDGELRDIPYYLRWVKLTNSINAKGRWSWDFKPLPLNHQEPKLPPAVPQHLVEEVKKVLQVAQRKHNQAAAPQLASTAPAAQLPGQTQTPQNPQPQPLQNPGIFDMTKAAEQEAQADY